MLGREVNFIILSQGRAGSTYLVHALNQHTDITAGDEILDRLGYLVRPGETVPGLTPLYTLMGRVVRERLGRWQLKRATRFYSDSGRKFRVVGFKAKVRHIVHLRGMKQVLESSCVKTIVMDRKNFVKQAVARIYGRRLYDRTKGKYASRAWNLVDESDRLGPQHIEVEEFDGMLKTVISSHGRLHAYAHSLSVPKLDLEYADLLRDHDGWLRSVFDFLGVEPRELDSRVLQNEPDDLRQALANFEDLKSHYTGTAFDAMFDEVVRGNREAPPLPPA